MFLSVVIPAYNEAQNIQRIVDELLRQISSITAISRSEIIICDDHSVDDTFQAVKQLHARNVKCVRLSRRSGSHVAIRAGLSVAKGDAVLCISADGQDDPAALLKMIQKIKEGKQIIWGVRTSRDEPLLKKQFARLFYKLLSIFITNESNIDLANADFYLLDRRVVDALNSCPERNTSLFGLIAWIGFKQDKVEYQRRERAIGKSKWNFKSKMRLVFDWIIAFSGLPLKLISVFGILIALIGFLYALLISYLSLSGRTTPGWAETVILVLLLGGIQMIMIGVIGEYLWRTMDESRSRPVFFIEESSDEDKNKLP
jgi:glycosyltransferase involved in cell wall biosynthesis